MNLKAVSMSVTAVAAVMLLYVGYWLHSKSYAQAWQHFIRDQVNAALEEKRKAKVIGNSLGARLSIAARGPVVEEAALVRALRNRQILGAGLDVTEKEPIDLENPLFGFDNVILTPHMATRALESDLNTLRFVVANIDRLARGEALQSVVLPV